MADCEDDVSGVCRPLRDGESNTAASATVYGTPYSHDSQLQDYLQDLANRVAQMRDVGPVSGRALQHLAQFFKVKNVYNSIAIEGNLLDYGETRLVVEQGLTISGKPLKDVAEAKNLSAALDMLQQLATEADKPITATDIRSLHQVILAGIDDRNAGKYRDVDVEITGSQFRPPSPEKLKGELDAFCEWFADVTVAANHPTEDPVLLACAAHAWFVYIHPFIDGNGRVARILMNLVLMRYGYPIAVITRDERHRYYEALEQSQASDLTPFIALVAESVDDSLEEYSHAAEAVRAEQEWASSIAQELGEREMAKRQNEYEVWRAAMELLRSYFVQSAEMINEQAEILPVTVSVRDYGMLEIEKYLSFRNGVSAKQTWFFRVDFRSGERCVRYLFWFANPSWGLRERLPNREHDVTLHVSRESPSRPYFYERLDQLQGDQYPDLLEVGYVPAEERFVALKRAGAVTEARVEPIVRDFISQVARRERF